MLSLSGQSKINVILFGLTGFGNSAFEALMQNSDIELKAVFTNQKPVNEFPYYHCIKLHDVVRKYNIPLYPGIRLSDSSSYEIIKDIDPDLIVVSTYNQRIPQEIIDLPRYGVINFHPSLLPKYRGATPTFWAIANGETESGITAHFIENELFDTGRIVLQNKVDISPFETDGLVRKRLSSLVFTMMSKTINLILSNDKKSFLLQDEREASFFSKRTDTDAVIDLSWSLEMIRNRIRALTPFPGAFVYLERGLLKVQGVHAALDSNFSENENGIIVDTEIAGRIKFIV